MWNTDPSANATIGWNALSGANHRVYYDVIDNGTDTTLYANVHTADASISYKGMTNTFARLTGLQPATIYYLVIADDQSVSSRFWFKTASAINTDRISTIAGGDSRNNRDIRQNANKLAAKLRADVICFGGDMINLDTDNEWNDWMNDWQLTIAVDGRITPMIMARGNHENSNASVSNLFDTDPNVYYANTFGGDLFRMYTLNTEISIAGTQTTWLQNDLVANQNVTWKSAQYHRPMRPHVSSKGEGNDQYSNWAQLFYDYDVKLVVECDAHTVKTTEPIMPGSGGDEGFLVDPNGTIYVGEGCWGAPIRMNDDNKSWTKASGKFNQFKWIWIDKSKIEVRTVKVDNADDVGQVTDTERFFPPADINIWNKDVIAIDNPNFSYPSVNIASPANEDHIATPQQITIAVNASDADGTVQQVEFFVDSASVGIATSSPFSFSWTIPAAGMYTIYARALDNDGFTSLISDPVTITAGYAQLSASSKVCEASDDAEEGSGGSVDLESSDLELVNDNLNFPLMGDQTVGMRFQDIRIPKGATVTNAYVQFTEDGTDNGSCNLTIKGEDVDNSTIFSSSNNDISGRTTTTASTSWAPPDWTQDNAAGADQQTPDITGIIQEIVDRAGWQIGNSLNIIITGSGVRTAHAYDGQPSKTPVLYVDFEVGAPATNQAPTIAITAPSDGTIYTTIQQIAIDATASDPDGTVQQVEFFVDGTSEGIDVASPYSVNWTPPANGTYLLTAMATDDSSATTTSNTVTVIVNQQGQTNVPPTIAITAPSDGTIYATIQQIAIDATASDPDGTVQQVEFFVDGISASIDVTSPYSVNWTPTAFGTYLLTATATDDSAATTTSAIVSVQFTDTSTTGMAILNNEIVFNIYPNPADHTLNVQLSGFAQQSSVLLLYDVNGKIAMKKQMATSQNSILTLDVSSLPAGNYFLSVRLQGGVLTKKVVVE